MTVDENLNQCHSKQNWKCGFSQGEDNCLSEQKMRCTDLIMYVLSMFLQNSFAGGKTNSLLLPPILGKQPPGQMFMQEVIKNTLKICAHHILTH